MKKNIAVIFGGRSAEHDVSIITAHIPIIQSLVAAGRYAVWPIYIAKDGSWYMDQAMNDLAYFTPLEHAPRLAAGSYGSIIRARGLMPRASSLTGFTRDDFAERLTRQKKARILFDRGLKIILPGIISKVVNIDVAFPAMHGTYGEDGSLMGLLRMAGIPFVGCDIFSSAVAMDKVLTKQVLAADGVPVVPYVWFTKNDWERDPALWKDKIALLKWPVFVKPVHLGSSIAIAKIKQAADLENAVETALHYDDKVLAEESVENLVEVTLPIMGNDTPRLGEIERPLNKTEFFDFSDKYLSGGKKGGGANSQYSEIPARIDEALAREVRDLGVRVYRILGCSGIARIDFLIDSEAGRVYVNEVNTLPGSLYHHNWKKVGVSGVELVTTLISLAEERFASRKNIVYAFPTDILRKAGGGKTRDA